MAGAEGPVVCADVVSSFGKYVAVFGFVCILGFFWANAKESRASVYAWGIECGWSHPYAVRLAEREVDGGAGQ